MLVSMVYGPCFNRGEEKGETVGPREGRAQDLVLWYVPLRLSFGIARGPLFGRSGQTPDREWEDRGFQLVNG